MMQPLEPSLWEALRSAQLMPERANLSELMPRVDAALAQLSEEGAQMTDSARLQAVGKLLLQVADLCAVRAEALMTGWEETHRDPIVEPDFFADVVRQTMAVDLSDLMEPAPLRQPRTKRIKPTAIQAGSVTTPIEKETLLLWVDQWEAEATEDEVTQVQQVLAISHEEDVSGWANAISWWMQAAPDCAVPLAELCHCLNMPWVEVWLGVLLGGFELEQRGEFYQDLIWVKCPEDEATAPESVP